MYDRRSIWKGEIAMNGKLIVIEGLDGSGKNTQSEKLFTYLKDAGKNVRKVSFPNYSSQSSALINMYLAGEFGSTADSVNPYAASSFYAVDRYASYKTTWGDFYNEGGIIIADRYTTSNAIHQCSKLPRRKWSSFLEWLFEYEYKYMGIPEPDCVIFLKVVPEVSQKLLAKRYSNDENKKDIHERDLDYLHRSSNAADYCAERLGWNVIECSADGEMRSVEDIFADIAAIIG